MKNQFRFWTPEEDKALKTCLTKFERQIDVAKWASKKFNRSVHSVCLRINLIKSGKEITYKTPKNKNPLKKENGFNIPEGFTFEFKPSKAVMFKDHIRLYF